VDRGGIAAGIAALGSIFTAGMERHLAQAHLTATSAPRVVTMVRQGQAGRLLAGLPPASRGHVAAAIRSSFAAGLNDVVLVTAALAFAGALCALLLIRPRDFVRAGRSEPEGVSQVAGETGADAASQARSA
jgi:hypothetical protein